MIIAALFAVLIQATPESLQWNAAKPPLPADVLIALLEGTLDGPPASPYTFRLKIPAGKKIESESVPSDQHVTVLTGALTVTIAGEAAKQFGAGGYFVVPSETQHTMLANDEAIVQVSGLGSWEPLAPQAPATEPVSEEKLTASIEVTNVQPPAGTRVDRRTTLHVTLRYSIDGFKRGEFINPQFESTTPGRTFNPANTIPAYLIGASGTYELEYPLAGTIADPKIRKPLRLSFLLNRKTGDNTFATLARTPTLEFKVK